MLGLQMPIAIGFPGEKAESLGELRRAKRQILRCEIKPSMIYFDDCTIALRTVV